MVDWLDDLNAHNEELRQETRADIAELRHEMQVGLAELREETRVGFASVREEMRVSLANVHDEMHVGFARIDARFAALEKDMANRMADVLKWMFGIWIASFAAIVGVLTLLRAVAKAMEAQN